MSEGCSASVKKAMKKNATLRAQALGTSEPTMSTRTDTILNHDLVLTLRHMGISIPLNILYYI